MELPLEECSAKLSSSGSVQYFACVVCFFVGWFFVIVGFFVCLLTEFCFVGFLGQLFVCFVDKT